MKALQLKRLCNESRGHYFKITVQQQKSFLINCDSELFDFSADSLPVIEQAFNLAYAQFFPNDIGRELSFGELHNGVHVATIVKRG